MIDGLNNLVDAVGLEPALRLIAGWGGSTLYVPGQYRADHLITKVIGEAAAIALERTYGGQTVTVPKINLNHITLEVNIIKLAEKGFSSREAAHILGVSKERVKQIIAKHRGSSDKAGDPGDPVGRGAADPPETISDRTCPVSYRRDHK